MLQWHCSSWLLPGCTLEHGGPLQLSCMRPHLSLAGPLVPTRTQNFHHFLKLALTKNPKKRPTAEKLLQVGSRQAWGLALKAEPGGRSPADGPLLLQHPFTTQHLPRALLTQLLDKASDPHLGSLSPEDCELEVRVGWGVGKNHKGAQVQAPALHASSLSRPLS